MTKLKTLLLVAASVLTLAAAPAMAGCKLNCGQNGSTGGSLAGNLMITNFAGADGDIALAMTENRKIEEGQINTVQDTDGSDRTVVKGKLATGGSGLALAASAGRGVQTAETIVSANMLLELEAMTFEK